ncbi:MAG: ABC transporter substrate-binding protein [Chloroflexi bacterium]|nr:ABC transporter substrate-binding protein [Chloroflexota bacterium]
MKCRMVVAFLLILVVLVPFSAFGCGGGNGDKVTITVGFLTDFTGPGGPAIAKLYPVIQDLVKYYNGEELIRDAKVQLITYDTRMDPARYVPGYDWLRERGAKVILTSVPGVADTAKPFAERDGIPIFSFLHSKAMMEPPGAEWVFSVTIPSGPEVKTLLNWVSENHWDYTNGIPKIGFYDWNTSDGVDRKAAIDEYCQAHPGKFNLVGSFLTPSGAMNPVGEVEKLKNCDYIYTQSIQATYFIKIYRDSGYQAQLLGSATTFGFYEFYQTMLGWERLDGLIITMVVPFWEEENPAVTLIKEFIDRYRPGKSPEAMGASYWGALTQTQAMFEILRQAVEEVGADNLTGRAVRDVAVTYSLDYEGLPKYRFTETVRYLVQETAVFEFSAQTRGLIRLSEWLSFVQ